jgi:hypothetical protein
MKEAWVFGQIDTIGPVEAEARTERLAREVVEMVCKENDGENGETREKKWMWFLFWGT